MCSMIEHNCTILNWNVRGLNNPARRQVVRNLASQTRSTVVCLQETKLAHVDRPLVLELLGSAFADSFCFLPAIGTRGGIILAFSSDFFSILSSSSTANTISASVSMRASVASWSISVVYGPQADSDKFNFISELRSLKASMLPSWVILGDFNLICRANDKSNGAINRRLINSFRSALNFLELDELRLHGRRFTWASSCPQQTKTKIDHVFCSPEWNLLFPQCHLRASSSSISDHCAMIDPKFFFE